MDFIFDPSLVLYLPLYELDGASFMSKDKHGHLCTVTGALWTPRGRSFDVTDDKISIPNHSALDLLSEVTIEAWIYPNDLTNHRYIYNRSNSATDGIALRILLSGELTFWTINGGSLIDTDSATGQITTGKWFHLAASRKAATAYVYKNAQDITDSHGSHVDPSSINQPAYVSSYQAASYFLGALLGEIRVYNRALTPLEIQHNYLATKWRYR